MTEASEFWKIYKLDVIGVPTNRPMKRIEHPDVIYRTEREKFNAIADEIERMNTLRPPSRPRTAPVHRQIVREDDDTGVDARTRRQIASTRSHSPRRRSTDVQTPGRPILVGTVSIEKSERLSKLLNGAASSTKCSTPSSTSARRRSSPRRAARRGDHRHEHGRPRYRHHPRRQPRDDGLGPAARQVPHAGSKFRTTNGNDWSRRSNAREKMKEEGAKSTSWAACTSSAPSGTKPGASTSSCAAVAAAKAIPVRAGSTCRWKTT